MEGRRDVRKTRIFSLSSSLQPVRCSGAESKPFSRPLLHTNIVEPLLICCSIIGIAERAWLWWVLYSLRNVLPAMLFLTDTCSSNSYSPVFRDQEWGDVRARIFVHGYHTASGRPFAVLHFNMYGVLQYVFPRGFRFVSIAGLAALGRGFGEYMFNMSCTTAASTGIWSAAKPSRMSFISYFVISTIRRSHVTNRLQRFACAHRLSAVPSPNRMVNPAACSRCQILQLCGNAAITTSRLFSGSVYW